MVLYVFAESFTDSFRKAYEEIQSAEWTWMRKNSLTWTITKNKKITDVQIEEVKKNCKEERPPKWTGQKLKLHYEVTNRNLQKTKTAETPTHV